MDFQEARKYLEDNGFVILSVSTDAPMAKLTRPEFQTCSEICLIFQKEGKWFFQRWVYTPGPGPDDVVYESNDLRQTADVAIRYYCGSPLILEGWIFPLHKHPEWEEEVLRASFSKARIIRSEEWFRINTEYHRRYISCFTNSSDLLGV